MPLYSKTIPDAEIKQRIVGKYHNILIISCAGCMNESLAFDNSLPIFSLVNGEIASFPAIEAECRRIAALLAHEGIHVEYQVIPTGTNSRCIINLDEPLYVLDNNQSFEAVLVLSCPSGFQDLYKRFAVPVYIISEQIGMINYTFTEINQCREIINGTISYF